MKTGSFSPSGKRVKGSLEKVGKERRIEKKGRITENLLKIFKPQYLPLAELFPMAKRSLK